MLYHVARLVLPSSSCTIPILYYTISILFDYARLSYNYDIVILQVHQCIPLYYYRDCTMRQHAGKSFHAWHLGILADLGGLGISESMTNPGSGER